jgi:hypothetical protein
MRSCAGLAGVVVLSALFLAPPPVEARAPRLALIDDLSFIENRPQERRQAFRRARASGARLLRLTLDWSKVAPGGASKPAGFDASDPASPRYNFAYVEDEVRDASRRGLGVILTIVHAPRWAEGRDKPTGSPAGAWRPNPAELARFVLAAARRFSGFYPDPKTLDDNALLGGGRALPRVRYWQIWDEPNGNRTLQPLREHGRLEAAEHYRRLLNASADAVHAVDDENVVVAAGTTDRGSGRAAPLAFWRKLLCVTRAGHRAPCPSRARFDVSAHNPLVSRPSGLLGSDRLGVRRLSRLRRLVARAVKLHTVLPVRAKPLWVTNLGWDTPPLAPHGVSLHAQSRYLAEGVYRAGRAGASVVVWRGLQDRVTYIPESFPSIRSGLYVSDRLHSPAKPSLAAYRFPFVVARARRGSLAWGLAPRRGRVAIQRLHSGSWRTLARVRTSHGRGFSAHLDQGRGRYRARQGGTVSPTWRR